ncbi:putative inositol polyphosphate 5-phosphatase C9G1.10c [Neonectria ditissima]|uniref:Putative inositol polyphosphate 5-phosphatase C9G1.10c n=1 Tax=Neonectria ditissima TaxID=78410 RepID=A0A0P7B8P0_9HYPO|nr:putative inositol polyphosphate 5-phosphatase C9G1.10c [Neonectria ditissima]
MERPNGDGPDGSSIKPVSSLRARFENINTNKPTDVPAPPSTPSRSISPAPKPDRLRDFKPTQEVSLVVSTTPAVPTRPQVRPKVAALAVNLDQTVSPSVPPPSTRPTPGVKPQAVQQQAPPPPAVTVQPPQSPPKGRVSGLALIDQSPFLNPDAVATPTTPGGSPRQFRIPSRPHTPSASVSLPRSPRAGGSNPPSPPPPRRSGEFRREPEPKTAPPPPAPRNGSKPLIPASKPPSSPDPQNQQLIKRTNIPQETSPFNSPPSSLESHGAPPKLPTRPRPQAQGDTAPRPRSVIIGFDPRSSNQSIASSRKDWEPELNGTIKGYVTPQPTGEPRPALPARPPTFEIPSRSHIASTSSMLPPPRPPRPTVQPVEVPPTSTPPKRVVSTPTTQQPLQQQLAPPTRTHGRSMTIDRASDRTPVEFRITPATPTSIAPMTSVAVTAPAKPIQSTPVAIKIAPKEPVNHMTTYPDASNTNRRPPYIKQGSFEIPIKYDARTFDVCGEFVCASGHMTRVWSLLDGEMVMSLSHTEGVKATAVAFKPAADPREEGKRLWVGTNTGDLMEVEIATHAITPSKANIHGRYEVIKIYRHFNEVWTLDESGTLLVWEPDNNSVANLTGNPTQSYKVPKGHTFSMVIGDDLWHCTGKEIRIFAPTADGRSQFQVLVRPLVSDSAGEITSGTLLKSQPDTVIFGHVDGKVTMYSITDYSCLGVINVSTWKINALANVGRHVWAAYNTGKVCVYDIEESPWIVKKEWLAHDNPIVKMVADPSSAYFLDRLQVISLGADNKIKAWDGLLQDDWLEDSMKSKDTQYCDFDEIKALFMTWNAGACTPSSLRYSATDSSFFQDLVQSADSPDILVFGFQELVDLEDKKLTAKRFLKPKKKEGSDQERMSHQYRDWRDFLMKTLDDYMPADDLYHLLHTAPMVGLFTCVFVKSSLRDRIRNLSGAEVKRGMGGLHGNKGAVAVRFRIDDTSICLINCHLAAGQSQANARHGDIAAILEAPLFTTERDPGVLVDTYVGGGDGSLIVDHELCILNGDLNYRIDTMSRDTVVTAVKQNNLGKLLERDQLLVARRRNPAFKLRAFDELPITFAPTYKYDVGTDTYDTSEKRRSPAWCDRLLFKGRGRIEQLDYKRHEVRVSDHRPVTGSFNLWVKKVDPKRRAIAWVESQQTFENMRQQETSEDK